MGLFSRSTFVQKHGLPKVLLLLLDVLAVILGAASTFFLHYFTGFDQYDLQNSMGEYLLRVGFFLISIPILVTLFRQGSLYKYKLYSTSAVQVAYLLRSVLLNALLLIAILFFVRQDWINHSRSNLILFSLCTFGYLVLFRVILFRTMILSRIANMTLRRVMIIGSNDLAQSLLDLPVALAHVPIKVVAVVDRHLHAQVQDDQVLILNELPVLTDFLADHSIQEVIIADDSLTYDEALRVMTESRKAGAIVNLLSDHFRVLHDRVTQGTSEFEHIAAAPVAFGPEGIYGAYIKRAFDITFTILILIVLSPVFLLLTMITKLNSRGPLIYKTQVIGQKGKPFTWYKFRTMRIDGGVSIHREHVAEHIRLGNRPTGKLANDPRITTSGKWLRKHSLDELPQLINVLRGDMSLVGPRPCLPYEYEQYQEWHKERFEVRPGLTGLWQVSARSSVSFNDMIVLDLYYIHNLSFGLDMAILFRTVSVVLTGKGGG